MRSVALARPSTGIAAGAAIVAGAATVSACVRRAGRTRALEPADAILVFGASVEPTGPSLSLRVRVARAAAVYHEGWAPTILCSGGWSGGRSEAGVMRELLVAGGVPADAVIPDDGGLTTREAIRSARRFGGGRWRRVIAVSSPYHVHRIGAEARRQGLAVILCPAPRPDPRTLQLAAFDLRQHVRELVAVPRYAAGWYVSGALKSVPGLYATAIDVRSRVRSLFGEADAVAAASDEIAALIKEGVVGFSDTEAIVAPGATDLVSPVRGSLESTFGIRCRRLHTGVDIAAPYGTPVDAPAAGRVLAFESFGPYGDTVVLDHGGGLASVFAHLAGAIVGAEQRIERGERLGYVGATGKSFGPHLHFELRLHGAPIDPLVYLGLLDDRR